MEPITEPTRFCMKMFDHFRDAAYRSGWATRRAPEGQPTFYAHKRKTSVKVTFGPNGQLTECKVNGEDIPVHAGAALLPLLFEMKDLGDE